VAIRRGVGLVLVLIGLAVMVSIAGMFFMYAMVSRGPAVPRSAMLVLRPGGNMPETVPDDVVGQVLGREVNTVRGFIEGLSKARRDPRIKTVLLMPSTIEMPFWAKVQEMRDAIIEFKTSGKTVVAFLEYGGDREYYLASAADKVFLLPTSPLDLAGIASYEIFLRGLFDKIGATPDFVKIGEYKTAVNQYTERAFTPAHREMAESLNREAFDQLVRGIAEGRKKTEEEVRALLDQGPFLPEDAKQAGLVDDLAYADEIDDKVPEFRDDDGELRRVEGTSYARSGGVPALRARARIAVIQAVGTIVSGRSVFDPINGELVGSETVVEQIRRVRDDDSVRAIIVRIDSPGGSSVASDVIWRELMITKEENPDVPIISSMSDLAAAPCPAATCGSCSISRETRRTMSTPTRSPVPSRSTTRSGRSRSATPATSRSRSTSRSRCRPAAARRSRCASSSTGSSTPSTSSRSRRRTGSTSSRTVTRSSRRSAPR
jgi:protease-4